MKKIVERFKDIGPGVLVAAGFIGPGTVTTCNISGASFGGTLLWAMLFSIIATIILQEMAGRLGIITQKGLGESLREKFDNPILKGLTIALVVSAIFIGNIAYETGNIIGGAMGLSSLTPRLDTSFWAIVMGVIAFILLWNGSHRSLEKFFIGLVLTMSCVFITTAIVIKPDMVEVLKGLFIPKIPDTDRGWMTVIGLIGTTIVPYNLFLHASSTAKKWSKPEDVRKSRIDTIICIGLGGLISMSIIITASSAFYGTGIEITGAVQMAEQLEPVLGSWAKWFFGLGLFAAGFTSAITAPLSAAYALGGALNIGSDLKDKKVRMIWIVVLLTGVSLAALGKSSPVEVILFAQGTNALILPIVAIFLTIILNDKEKMGEHSNSHIGNVLALIVVGVTISISVRSFTLFWSGLVKLIS